MKPLLLTLLLPFACACAPFGRNGRVDGHAESSSAASDVGQEALRVHRSALLVDGHNDLPWALREKAHSSFEAKDIALPQPDLHTDIPRLLRGGVGAQFWSVYVPVDAVKRGAALRWTLEQIDVVVRMARRYPETFELARTVEDVERARGRGRIACLIGAEGGHSIEGSLGALRMLHELGVRYMTLAHSDTNDICDSATDEPEWGGLSPFGEEVVREMNRLGMLVDISHVSQETMEDVLTLTQAPVIASHSSCRALAPHPRNVPDEVLARMRENGGVVMVNFYPGFLVESSARKMAGMFDVVRKLRAEHSDEKALDKAIDEWRKANPIERGSVQTVVDHIEHIAKVAGIDCAGIGSDFDGIGDTPEGLEDVSCYPRITQELLARGYEERSIHKVLGGNVLRALARAEDVAREMTRGATEEVPR